MFTFDWICGFRGWIVNEGKLRETHWATAIYLNVAKFVSSDVLIGLGWWWHLVIWSLWDLCRIWHLTRRIDARIGARFASRRSAPVGHHLADHGPGHEWHVDGHATHGAAKLRARRAHDGCRHRFWPTEPHDSGRTAATASRQQPGGRLVRHRPLNTGRPIAAIIFPTRSFRCIYDIY